MSYSRRRFLQNSAALAVGFTGLQRLILADEIGVAATGNAPAHFPNLVTDPAGLLDLPPGFTYRIVSRTGETMNDGLLVPARPDGMATFPGPDGLTVIVRNHEIDPTLVGPFGENAELLDRIDTSLLYDLGEPSRPCIGGTTTLVYDTQRRELVRQFLSLSGTTRNCAGGPTPWGSWISCEEASDRPGYNTYEEWRSYSQQFHGYNFEVPASATMQLTKAIPLRDMGRFRHEAVAVEPKSGIVYQTEDLEDGLIYRFLPNQPGKLAQGGKLQALALRQRRSADLRNWSADERIAVGAAHEVEWIDLEDIQSPDNDLRYRGFAAGAAKFARAEGMWYSKGSVYFACTNGGPARIGQIWKYTPSAVEGQAAESSTPGSLELFVEPNNSNLVANADNLTAAPWGDLVVCEDRKGDVVRLVGVTPEGQLYTLANNQAGSEFAGVCFTPDGSTLLVNLQEEGITFAVTGPWPSLHGH